MYLMGVRLVNNREKIVAALKQQVADGINSACQMWTDEAQRNANVDTGFMKSHIGQTVAAVPNKLEGVVRSLAPYSGFQDTGRHGNLFWTRAYITTRAKFRDLIFKGIAYTGSAGGGVIKSALSDYHR